MSKIVQVDQKELLILRFQELLLWTFLLVVTTIDVFIVKTMFSRALNGVLALLSLGVMLFRIKPWALVKEYLAFRRE